MRKNDIKLILITLPIIYLFLFVFDSVSKDKKNKVSENEYKKASFVEFKNDKNVVKLKLFNYIDNENYLISLESKEILKFLNNNLKKEVFFITFKNKECITEISAGNILMEMECLKFEKYSSFLKNKI
jgi:hypothetical protein